MDFDASDERRPRLTPAIADVRRAVRESLAGVEHDAGLEPVALVLVGLSGGADSLALSAATAFEAPRAGIRAGAVIVDHGLQPGSADVAARAAEQASTLGLSPVTVSRVRIRPSPPPTPPPTSPSVSPSTPKWSFSAAHSAQNDHLGVLGEGDRGGREGREGRGGGGGGPEADARAARYGAFEAALAETGARHLLLAHTLDDQAETVLLGLARGSGPTSLHGMAAANGPYLRPLLRIRRAMTRQFCADAALEPWDDPHNLDPAYARVRVRSTVLPSLEAELGPGIAEALARTAEQLREDDDALDAMILETIEDICEPAEAGIAVSVGALTANPPALRHRIIRYVVFSEFGVSLERVHVLAVARLVTDWHGQKPLDLPGIRVAKQNGLLVFTDATAAKNDHS